VQFPLRGPGYLDFDRAEPALNDAAKIYVTQAMRAFADGRDLGEARLQKARVAPPSDKSFAEFASALALVNSAPLGNDQELYWKQGFLDVLATYPIESVNARFEIESSLARMSMETHTVMRFLPPDNAERAFSFTGNPGRIHLDPGWWRAAYSFVLLGFEHILVGIDHLLFLLCLVIPTRSVRQLIPVITAFTVAHSITLISSAMGLIPTAAWFGPLIETLIALSVCYMAIENMLGMQMRKRWVIVFAFGLIHGFGFSFILADRMQFAGDHLLSALVAFNVGVELGQLLVLLVAVPILSWLVTQLSRLPNIAVSGEQAMAILLSVFVAHTAWHWLTERGAQLFEYSWQAPAFDTSFFIAAMRWGMLLVGSVAVLWALNELFDRFQRDRPAE
jgi:hypothetical protein